MTRNDLLASEVFDLAPVALFHSDFSQVYELMQRWRAAGIENIEAHLRANPKAIDEYYASIQVLKVNRRSLDLYGADSLETLLAAASSIFAQENREAPIREIGCIWRGERAFHSETINHKIDGTVLRLRIGITMLEDANMPWDRVLVALEDLTEARNAQQRASDNERYAHGLFNYSPISLWVNDFSEIKSMLQTLMDQGIDDFRTFVDVHPDFIEQCMGAIRTIDVNQQTLTMFGATSKQELLSRLGEIFRDEMAVTFSEQLIDLWNNKLFQQREIVNYSLKGEIIHAHMQWAVLPGHETTWERALVALTDISARKKAEAYLEFLGKHDALTKLRNRAYCDEEINRVSRRGPFPTAVIVLDVNELKAVNDQHGHAAGDSLIRRAAEAIKKACGESYQPARTGGDEFSVLLPGKGEESAREFLQTLALNIDLNNQFYSGPRLAISAGWGVCERTGELEAAIRHADQMMYSAKRDHYAKRGVDRRS